MAGHMSVRGLFAVGREWLLCVSIGAMHARVWNTEGSRSAPPTYSTRKPVTRPEIRLAKHPLA